MDRRTFLLAGGSILTDAAASSAAVGGSALAEWATSAIFGSVGASIALPVAAATMRVPAIVNVPFDAAALTADLLQYPGGRYERFKDVLVFTADAIALKFQVTDFSAGGSTAVSFGYPRYALHVSSVLPDGTLTPGGKRASYVRQSTERVGTLVGAFGNEADGPVMLTIVGYDVDGKGTPLMTHGAYLDRNGEAKGHPMTIMQTCSRDWITLATMRPARPFVYQYVIVGKSTLNTTRVTPLAPRLGVPFSLVLPAANITRIDYAVGSDGVGCPPCITASGITTTEARQNYSFSDVIAKVPRLPLLDGDRGVCTTPYTTDLVCGRNGKLYGANPWQAWVMDATGHKRTLYGIRHLYPPIWSEATLDGPEVEVVGDWDSSIPLTERHAWESWGMAWDTRTLAIAGGAPIPPGETEHPHIGAGPVHFRTDRHGYILRVQFDGHKHTTPAKVQRWLPAEDPWGIFYNAGKIYTTERGENRISIWSADNQGHYLGDLIAEPAAADLGMIDPLGRRWSGAPYAECRTLAIVAPEGLQLLDGYVYWGSLAQREVRRMPLHGGPVEVCCRPSIGGNSRYVYIAISDGNFGPRGTLFVTTWENETMGRPEAFLPAPGLALDGVPLTHGTRWKWQTFAADVPHGPGGAWGSDGYASAVAVGRMSVTGRPEEPTFGALACSSATGNISVYLQADPTLDGTPIDYVSARRGGDYYRANFQVLHGPWCAGPDLPLPWGADPDCDYFMSAICGYPRT